jgi:hypothetical protein
MKKYEVKGLGKFTKDELKERIQFHLNEIKKIKNLDDPYNVIYLNTTVKNLQKFLDIYEEIIEPQEHF